MNLSIFLWIEEILNFKFEKMKFYIYFNLIE